jgi:succinate dehydrogenase/fumarate reductase flavoprotein subunit
LAQRNSHNPFSSRDKLSRYVDFAIIGELKAGRGTHHQGIYLDRSDPQNPPLAKPAAEFWAYRGIDFGRPVEASICHHCSLGGFRIDENAETTVAGLFAAGEVAAGPHGADRMGGHMLLASQVFGARAGKNAAARASRMKPLDLDTKVSRPAEERIESLRQRRGKQSPAELKNILQRAAYFDLLTIRSQESLTRFLSEVKRIKEDLCPDMAVNTAQSLIEGLELQNLLTLAELEAGVCLARTESRGPHFRTDFPQQDDQRWLKSITAAKVNDKLQIKTISLDPTWKSEGDEKMGYWG